MGRCPGAILCFNMSSQVWTFLPQRMHDIAVNRLEQNNTPFSSFKG